MKNIDLKKGEIVIYKPSKDKVELKLRLEGETIWLDTRQMALLFGTQRPAVVKHVRNIYKAKELVKSSTCSILEQVAADGKKRKLNFYNQIDFLAALLRGVEAMVYCSNDRTLKKKAQCQLHPVPPSLSSQIS